MLDRFRRRVRPHARSVALVAGAAGGLYIAGSYLLDRLKDIQTKVTEERAARESLRRRFVQNQEDCTFTLLALLPTLSAQIMDEMDVEDLTHQLQQLSSKPKSSTSNLEDSVISLATSEATSQASSADVNAAQPDPATTSSEVHPIITAGTDQPDVDGEGQKTGEVGQAPTSSDVGASWSSEFQQREAGQDQPRTGEQLEASVISISSTADSTSTSSSPPAPPRVTLPEPSQDPTPAPSTTHLAPPKTKIQLWNELKLLTFTRTLTTLYTLTLLTLQTRIQLNLLGRHSYVRSVKELERSFAPVEPTTGSSWWSTGETQPAPPSVRGEDEVSPEDEMVYLSFSWWLMNVGWREVAERVQSAVAEVIGPLSLKKILIRADFEALLIEIRRRVEFDLGGDSIPRPHAFLPHLLPPTPATLSHLLTSTSLPPLPESPNSPIRRLLEETETYLSSPSFESCLSSSLALAFGSLVDSLLEKGMLGQEGVIQAGGGEGRFEEIVETKGKRLAEVLAEVARFGRESLEDGTMGGGNRVVDSLADLPELASFSAVVYSSYLGVDVDGF